MSRVFGSAYVYTMIVCTRYFDLDLTLGNYSSEGVISVNGGYLKGIFTRYKA